MRFSLLFRSLLLVLLLSFVGCQAAPDGIEIVATSTPAEHRTATATPLPTPTPILTPPVLPPTFQSRYLNPLDEVHTYVDDTCTYLRNRWDQGNAEPGTVVMIIMLHSINRAKGDGPEALTAVRFSRMMEELHEQKFQAIDLQELAAFLENNSRIPARSVVLLQDQSRYPGNFNTHFRTYWDAWGWPVVNAWDAQASVSDALWEDYGALSKEGLVDFQVYGPTLSMLAKPTAEEKLLDQLRKPIEILEDRLGKTPIGVVWPSGFTEQSVRAARQLGYRVGFTFNSRGPVMYNWIPLSATVDKLRPSYHPESEVGDPLMTLPRFWPHQVHTELDAVRITGEEAAADAKQNMSIELSYYEIACAAKYGPIPLQ